MHRAGDGAPRRADRWLALHAARPMARLASLAARAALGPRAATARVPPIPVLMYHAIADDVDDTVHPYLRTVTTPAAFARQMDRLAARGLHAVTLTEALARLGDLRLDRAGLARLVVLTFDDGFRDVRDQAWPVMARHGFRGTVFLATGFLGRDFVTGRACLGARDVRALAAEGLEFGSHTVSHPRLVTLDEAAVRRELVDSREAVEALVGHSATLFSYPYRFPQEDAAFVDRLGTWMVESGYRAGVTTVIGRARARDDVRFLPRLPVNDADDDALLDAKLDGHYDWMRPLQQGRKHLRAWMGGA